MYSIHIRISGVILLSKLDVQIIDTYKKKRSTKQHGCKFMKITV